MDVFLSTTSSARGEDETLAAIATGESGLRQKNVKQVGQLLQYDTPRRTAYAFLIDPIRMGSAARRPRTPIEGSCALRQRMSDWALMGAGPAKVVLDTNVFVAAGFNPGSHSAQLIAAVREGRLRMVWDDATRAEIEHVMRRIPRLSWTRVADLFRAEDRFAGATNPQQFGFVPDPADRKFAALADAAQAPLVTSDAGLLRAGGHMAVPVLKPSEFVVSRFS